MSKVGGLRARHIAHERNRPFKVEVSSPEYDLCVCGDYRKDHRGGTGMCTFNCPNNVGHGGAENCDAFRARSD